jgi:hypothetical protein
VILLNADLLFVVTSLKIGDIGTKKEDHDTVLVDYYWKI